MRELIWIARIARSDALYDAPNSARTFEAPEQVILNPIEFDGLVGENLDKATETLKYAHVERYDNFLSGIPKDANGVNYSHGIKVRNIENSFQSAEFIVFQKSDKQLKSDGGLTIRSLLHFWVCAKWRSRYIATHEIF